MKVDVYGIVDKVYDVRTSDKGQSQKVLLKRPVFDQFTGELRNTNFYPVTVFDKRIDELKFSIMEGKKVKASCYLNSVLKTKDGESFYMIYLSCISVEEIKTSV